jgi:alanyl-tRNA synthetase
MHPVWPPASDYSPSSRALARARRPATGVRRCRSSQELADAARSVREVVARVLRELRVAGVIATAADRIVILDATRLYAESGGSAGL